MKKIGFFLMLLTMSFVSCDKSGDLWDEIDDLKVRVNKVEAEMNSFNEDIKALKALINAKTIVSVDDKSEEEGFIAITLSDGKVYKVVKNIEGQAQYPMISIDEEGHWIVSYDNGKQWQSILLSGKPVNAKAENIEEPEFSVSKDGYWEVRFSKDGAWMPIENQGKPVSAIEGGKVTGSKFFKDVKEEEGNLKLILANGKELVIPIVPNFFVRFSKVQGVDFSNTILLAEGEEKTFAVEVSDDTEVTLIASPSNWDVALSPVEEGKAMLTIHAPNMNTRASADNAKDITILGTKTPFSTQLKMQVEIGGEEPAQPEPEEPVTDNKNDLYAQYEQGKDIDVNGIKINKVNFPKAILVDLTKEDIDLSKPKENLSDYESKLKDSGAFNKEEGYVVFLDGDKRLTTGWIDAKKSFAVISRDATKRAKFTYKSCTPEANADVVFKNLEVTIEGNYCFGVKNDGINNLVIENCIFPNMRKNLYYTSSAQSGIKNVVLINNKFLLEGDVAFFKIGKSKNLDAYQSYTAINNVFSNTKAGKSQLFDWGNNDEAKQTTTFKAVVTNNTFVNFVPVNVCFKMQNSLDLEFEKNILWADSNFANHAYIYSVYGDASKSKISIKDNIAFGLGEGKNWSSYHSKSLVKEGATINKVENDPFESKDFDNGDFLPLAEYANYGVQN